MNKTELIDTVAKDSGLARTDAARAVESILSAVTNALKKGDEVTIPGFGKFSVAHRGAREGRNPATGAPLKIKASKAPETCPGAAPGLGLGPRLRRLHSLLRQGTTMTSGCFKSVGFMRVATVLMVIGALALAGCGSSGTGGSSGGAASAGSGQTATSPQHVDFAKTKFIFHAALAFGAFHRYIYKPFRRGGFRPPSQHKAALVKAGLAALFAYHEAKIAITDAQSSPLLSKLVAPLTALQRQLSGLSGRLKSGVLDATGISAAASTVDRIGAQSASSYKAIPDAPTPSLGG